MNTVLKNETLTDIITTTTSTWTRLKSSGILSEVVGYAITLNIVVDTPAAGVFTAAASDLVTDVAHGFTTGLKGQASTTTTLPAGLALTTDYFVIVISADTYKLASSLALALAGTAIDITDAGTGTHTFTPTAIAGASYQTLVSTDSVNWVALAAATNITASATVLVEKLEPMYDYVKITYLITAGRMQVQQNLSIKGV